MKTTKRALFSSVIALILCFSMLVGTTFAWFTDSVESGVNKIIAGNLDVEVYYGDPAAKASIQDITTLFDDVNGKPILWEPGAVAFEKLTVANEGTLALKYQMAINFTKENEINGTGAKLSQILKIAVVDAGALTSREAALAAAKAAPDAATLHDFVLSGELAATTQNTYGIVIWWEPSANDNNWNVNNGKTTSDGAKYLHIDLGIKLVATQLEAEDDSFDETYDEDAWHPDMFVTTAAELAKAIEEVKDGGIIALGNNLTFDEESRTHNSGTYYDGLYYIGDKSFTIDLNGKTITNDSAINDYLLNFKNSGAKPNTITIKNGTIEATKSAYCAIATSSTNTQKITINLENVNLIGNNSNGAVAKIRGGAELNVKAGTVITGKDSYVGIEAVGNDTVVNVYEGAKIYQNGTSSYIGSLIGASYNATANVYGGYGKSAKGGFIAMTSGGTINVHGGEWIANTDGTVGNNSNVYVLTAQNNKNEPGYVGASIINVTGGTFRGGMDAWILNDVKVEKAELNISGGQFNANPSAYVASGFKAIDNGNGSYTVIFPQESFDNLIENAGDNATIDVPAGTYTFPASDLKAGQTLNCAPGTVFEGKSAMDIKGATVIGATFSNPDGVAGAGTINGTFKDCVFEGEEALRWCYAGETVVFENCEFKTDFRGVHFDGMDHDVIFRNCKLNGFNAISGTATVTFEGCTFGHDESRYNGLNMYCNTVLKDCKFEFVSGKTNFIDFEKAGYTLTITNCTATLDGEAANVLDFVGGTYVKQTNITIDGVPYVATSEALNAAVKTNAVISLVPGEYELTATAIGATIKGASEETVRINAAVPIYGFNGKIPVRMHFENLTFTNTMSTFQDTATEETGGTASTFTNVTFGAGFRHGYGSKVVFTDCTFGSNTEGYALHFEYDEVGTAGEIKLTGCKFLGGKVHLGGPRTYAFTNCDFATGTDFQVWTGVTLNGCTVNGVAVTTDNISTLFPNLDINQVTVK